MAGTIDPTVQQIRDRIEIVELIGRVVPLKRAGSSYKACCPFHQEKTPSFHVNPQRQFYYCFGCGAKGDAFSFLMNYEGKTFGEVVRELAEELGIEVHFSASQREEVTRAEQRKELLAQINQAAKHFFALQLKSPEGKAARDYLERRGVSEEMIESFGLGYALDDWGALTDHLQEQGYALEDINEAGLIKQAESSDRYYDRLRHRLIFPIYNTHKRIVGFGGRALRSDDGAKYLNSPESPLFRKSELLYGLDVARQSIRRSKTAVLVEGYMDVITLHQYGFHDAVATLGTSLTPEHVKELGRVAQRLVLLFDADKAGYRAASRALGLLLPAGVSVDMLTLPEGDDPDSFLHREGREAFETYLSENTRPAFDGWLEYLLTQSNHDPIQIRAATDDVLDLLHKISDPILQGLYLRLTSERLGVEETVLRQQFMRVVPQVRYDEPPPPMMDEPPPLLEDFGGDFFDDGFVPIEEAPVARPARTADTSCEERAIMGLIKALIENCENVKIHALVSQADVSQRLRDPLWKGVWEGLLEDLADGAESSVLIEGVLRLLEPHAELKAEMASSLLKGVPIEPEIAELMVEEIMETFRRLEIERQIQEMTLAIREACKAGDEHQAIQLSQEKIVLQRQLPRLQRSSVVAS